MNENLEFEYTVRKKVEGSYLIKRILFIIGYVIFALAFFFGLYLAHLYQFIAFIVLVEWILVFFTWRYAAIEYRYETVSGGIKFINVYGGKKKKTVLDMRIKDFDAIAPYDEEIKKNIANNIYSEVYDFSPSVNKDEDKYYALFKTPDGKSAIVLFEATQQSLKIFRFYNQRTTVINTRY